MNLTHPDRPSVGPYGAFAQALARWPDRPFLHENGQDRSYAQVSRIVELRLARYQTLGVGPGQRIGVLLANSGDFFIHLLALAGLGASVVPLSPEAPAGENAALLSRAGVAAVIAPVALCRALDLHPRPLEEEADLALCIVQSGLTRAQPDEAALLFTSGTTGEPKGCILSRAYFDGIGAHYVRLGGLCAFDPAGDRLATPLPVTHMNALSCSFMAVMLTGGCLIQLARFSSSRWWEDVRAAGATIVHYLGVMPAILLQAEPSSLDRAHAIRFGFGAGVEPKHHGAFEQRFGFPLIEAWAMTETGAGAWITACHEPRHIGNRCFGREEKTLEVFLADKAGQAVSEGEAGELLVRQRGPDPRRYFFSGYDGDEAASEAAWQGGWFHTGDIVRRGPDGSLFFVDRAKNIVRRSGENISAVQVEGVLVGHPGVGTCAVVPVADDMRGEEVAAVIVPRGGDDLHDLADALFDLVCGQLAYFKAPGFVIFTDAMPMTPSQKLRRAQIKVLAASAVADGTAIDLRPRKRRSR